MNAHWLVPDWPMPPGVNAVFTTRQGGLSPAPFDSMNLGDHVGDAPAGVAANRALLSNAVGARAVFLQQVHGVQVAHLSSHTPDGSVADACLTAERQVACIIMAADCLPVLLATRCGTWVGAVHAGWRGLSGGPALADNHKEPGSGSDGVLEAIFQSFSAVIKTPIGFVATDLIAWLGPCIGPGAFEVGEDVKAAFEATQPDTKSGFVAAGPGKFMADLPALARCRLHMLGVGQGQIYGNDSSAAWCTASNPSSFFSHRRDTAVGGGNGFGTTGRMAACIWKT